MSRTITIQAEVPLDFDTVMENLSDDDIAEEYATRELGGASAGLGDIKELLQRRDEKGAMALLKKMVCDEYGIVL